MVDEDVKEAEQAVLEEADKVLDDIADDILQTSVEHLNDGIPESDGKPISNTGFLAGSGNVNRKFLEKEIVFSAGYAGYVEFGVEPHWPPEAPIRKWCRLKLQVPDDELDSVTYLVQRKISQEGISPSPFLRSAIEKVKEKYQ